MLLQPALTSPLAGHSLLNSLGGQATGIGIGIGTGTSTGSIGAHGWLQAVRVETLAGSDRGLSGCADGLGWTARFDSPRQIFLKDADTLLVADAGNHRIRALNLNTSTSIQKQTMSWTRWVGI
jgi:hypothetical protein